MFRFVSISVYGDHADCQNMTEDQAKTRFEMAAHSGHTLYAAYFEPGAPEPANQYCKFAGEG